jgi:hypothetical protein
MPETAEFASPSRTPVRNGEPETKPFTQSGSPDTAMPADASGQPGLGGAGAWLHCAAAGLFVLAGAAAAVSFSAQYRLVLAARGVAVAAALEAAIPDAAALVFACLGVALAMHGRNAVRARLLNAASAGTSVFMNVIAAAPGWRDVTVWVMPPAAYALASDTLIGVIRARVASSRPDLAPGSAPGDASMLAVLGGLALWLLRLVMAPVSTLAGFRAWALAECPVAPGRRAAALAQPAAASLAVQEPAHRRGSASEHRHSPSRDGTKTARFLALVTEQHGPLATIPVQAVSRVSAALAPQVGLNAGAARTALRRAVLAAQDGGAR